MAKQGTIPAVYCSDELMHKINPTRLMPVHMMPALFLALLAVLIGIKHDASITHPQNAFFFGRSYCFVFIEKYSTLLGGGFAEHPSSL